MSQFSPRSLILLYSTNMLSTCQVVITGDPCPSLSNVSCLIFSCPKGDTLLVEIRIRVGKPTPVPSWSSFSVCIRAVMDVGTHDSYIAVMQLSLSYLQISTLVTITVYVRLGMSKRRFARHGHIQQDSSTGQQVGKSPWRSSTAHRRVAER